MISIPAVLSTLDRLLQRPVHRSSESSVSLESICRNLGEKGEKAEFNQRFCLMKIFSVTMNQHTHREGDFNLLDPPVNDLSQGDFRKCLDEVLLQWQQKSECEKRLQKAVAECARLTTLLDKNRSRLEKT